METYHKRFVRFPTILYFCFCCPCFLLLNSLPCLHSFTYKFLLLKFKKCINGSIGIKTRLCQSFIMRLGITLIALYAVLSICEYSSVTFLSFISKFDVLKRNHLFVFFKSDLLLALELIVF